MYGLSRQPWYADLQFRLRFEQGARQAYPDLRRAQTGRAARHETIYTATVEMQGYEFRRVKIRIRHGYLSAPRVFADGPADSDHRYRDGSLCMWHPPASEDRRWVPDDGLHALIDTAQLHLMREAYVRETGAPWPGPEVPHGPNIDSPAMST